MYGNSAQCILFLLGASGCCTFSVDMRITACLDPSSSSVNIRTRGALSMVNTEEMVASG